MQTFLNDIGITQMRKIVFSIFVFGVLIGLTATANQINELEKLKLRGKVKSLMEIKYSVVEEVDSLVNDTIISQKYTVFNESGHKTEAIIYRNGSEIASSKCLFGAFGKQVELNEYDQYGTLYLTIAYKYDDKGYRIEANYDWSGQRRYDENMQERDIGFEVLDENPFIKVTYKNDYRGFCTEEKYLKADGSLSFKYTHKYDFKGNKLEKNYFNSSGKLIWRTTYRYDRNNNMKESKLYRDNRIAVKSTFKYQCDASGNWVSRLEEREVHRNILTAHLDSGSILIERKIEYY